MKKYLQAQASGHHAKGLLFLLRKDGMYKVPFIKCVIGRGALVSCSQDSLLAYTCGFSSPETGEPTTEIVLRATSPESAKEAYKKIDNYFGQNALWLHCMELK